MTRVVAVTGATGAPGAWVAGRVAARAVAAGVRLRLVVRDAARAPRLPGAEVTAFPRGYADAAGFAAALAGAHTGYLVSAAEAHDRLRQHPTAVRAAAAAGVRRIVSRRTTEQALAAAGVRWTALRHLRYADFVPFLTTPEGDGGVIAAPAGDGRASFVSRDDCADVAGRPVTYRDQTVEEAWATRRSSGRPDWEIEGWVTSCLAIAAGELAHVSDVVPRVTGQPALSVAEHLRRHPQDWAPLAR